VRGLVSRDGRQRILRIRYFVGREAIEGSLIFELRVTRILTKVGEVLSTTREPPSGPVFLGDIHRKLVKHGE
jgi:hypothetical protein